MIYSESPDAGNVLNPDTNYTQSGKTPVAWLTPANIVDGNSSTSGASNVQNLAHPSTCRFQTLTHPSASAWITGYTIDVQTGAQNPLSIYFQTTPGTTLETDTISTTSRAVVRVLFAKSNWQPFGSLVYATFFYPANGVGENATVWEFTWNYTERGFVEVIHG